MKIMNAGKASNLIGVTNVTRLQNLQMFAKVFVYNVFAAKHVRDQEYDAYVEKMRNVRRGSSWLIISQPECPHGA